MNSTGAKRIGIMALGALLLGTGAIPQAAQAQFSSSYKFLEAVRKSDGAKVVEMVEQPGVTLIDTKDQSTGETALMITIGRRDLIWTNYLVQHGARVDLTDNRGRSALMIAVEKRFLEGATLLLAKKANPNQTNDSGETPLIRAVQMNDLDMVRLLMGAGANPDKRDTLAGMSALDYAQRGNHAPGIVEALKDGQKAAPSKAVQGPQL